MIAPSIWAKIPSMATLTADQVSQLQALSANVEVAWQNITRARAALSFLINAGKATCNDIKTYNLVAKSTYYYQRTMADTIRAAGGQAPAIPAPMYVAYKGKSGDDAINWDCSQLAGCVPNGFGDFCVDPRYVEWRAELTPSDVAAVQETLSRVSFADKPSDLGAVPVAAIIYLVIVAITVGVIGYIALKIVEAFAGLPQKVEYTKQMAVTAERHRATMEARAKCLADCTAQGKDEIACAKACANVFPDFKPPSQGGGLGIWGWVLGVGLVGGLAYLGWRAWHGGGRYAGIEGGHDDDGDQYDDGDDGDDDAPDDVIDVDFLERVA